jgi:hypothetical protein
MDRMDPWDHNGPMNSPQTAQDSDPKRLAFVVVTAGKTREQMKADARALWALHTAGRRPGAQR